jgi:hypothetical protein
MAIKWAFYRDSSARFRWEVQGEGGPIATGGKTFDSLDACVADAKSRGYDGSDGPPVSAEPSLPGREAGPEKSAARAK